MQDIVLAEKPHGLIYPPYGTPTESPLFPPNALELCQHIGFKELIIPVVKSFINGKGSKVSTSHTCDKYKTDSQIDVCMLGSKAALIMTRWVYLGPGVISESLFWKYRGIPRHLVPKLVSCSRSASWEIGKNKPGNLLPDPRSCLEKLASGSFQDLQSRNASYLQDQRYLKVFHRNLLVWYKSFEEPGLRGAIHSCRYFMGRELQAKPGTIIACIGDAMKEMEYLMQPRDTLPYLSI